MVPTISKGQVESEKGNVVVRLCLIKLAFMVL